MTLLEGGRHTCLAPGVQLYISLRKKGKETGDLILWGARRLPLRGWACPTQLGGLPLYCSERNQTAVS